MGCGNVTHGRRVESGCVVDENIQPAKHCDRPFDQGRQLAYIQKVRSHGKCRMGSAGIQLRDQCGRSVGRISIMNDDIRAQRVQMTYDSSTDPPGAAGNQHRVIL